MKVTLTSWNMRANRRSKKRKQRPVKILVTAARPIAEAELNRIHKLFGQEYQLEFREDKQVIGGLEIRKTNELFDGTIKGQLEKLRHKLYNLKAYGERK